jgi:hypothetical protein
MVAIPVPPIPIDSDVYDRLHAPLTTAYHEAGHCIAAMSLGHEVTRLTLESCRTGYRRNDAMAHWTEAVICMAGPLAEGRRRFDVTLFMRSPPKPLARLSRPTSPKAAWSRQPPSRHPQRVKGDGMRVVLDLFREWGAGGGGRAKRY